jgi:hypothetical protein
MVLGKLVIRAEYVRSPSDDSDTELGENLWELFLQDG